MMAKTAMMMTTCRRLKRRSSELILPHAQSQVGTLSGSLGVWISYMMQVECFKVLHTMPPGSYSQWEHFVGIMQTYPSTCESDGDPLGVSHRCRPFSFQLCCICITAALFYLP